VIKTIIVIKTTTSGLPKLEALYAFFLSSIDRPDPIDVINSEVAGLTHLRLTWTPPNDNFADIKDYRVEFRLMHVPGITASVLVFTEAMAVIPVKFHHKYLFQISGCNNAGCGNPVKKEILSPRPSKQLCCCVT